MLLMAPGGAARLQRSRLGYEMVAVRENEAAAAALGIDAYRVKLIAMALSAGITALGGTFYAQYFSYVDPTIGFGSANSIEILLRPIIGGAGTIRGPRPGAVVFGVRGGIAPGFVTAYARVHRVLYGL